MKVQYEFIHVVPDNDASYFSLLEGVIDAQDPYAEMSIAHAPEMYHFRVIPSAGILIDRIIQEINLLNNLIGIKAEMSKSMKTSSSIYFKIQT